MNFLLSLLLFTTFNVNSPEWMTDFDKAKTEAAGSGKLILLNFSGSDWCIPCIRLHKEIFQTEAFEKYAEEHLILVNADFPRLKKNQLSKEQIKKNEKLADKYNAGGAFPLTLLLDADGKVLKQWNGFPKGSAEEFRGEINALIHDHK